MNFEGVCWHQRLPPTRAEQSPVCKGQVTMAGLARPSLRALCLGRKASRTGVLSILQFVLAADLNGLSPSRCPDQVQGPPEPREACEEAVPPRWQEDAGTGRTGEQDRRVGGLCSGPLWEEALAGFSIAVASFLFRLRSSCRSSRCTGVQMDYLYPWRALFLCVKC